MIQLVVIRATPLAFALYVAGALAVAAFHPSKILFSQIIPSSVPGALRALVMRGERPSFRLTGLVRSVLRITIRWIQFRFTHDSTRAFANY